MNTNDDKLKAFLLQSLEEDVGPGDITSDALFDSNDVVTGTFRSKEQGIVAGLGRGRKEKAA